MVNIYDLGNLDIHFIETFTCLADNRQGQGTAVIQAEGLFHHTAHPSFSVLFAGSSCSQNRSFSHSG
jgi:hypothetical protein